eukprot:108936-Pleurochrysis_carterae.AAC.2
MPLRVGRGRMVRQWACPTSGLGYKGREGREGRGLAARGEREKEVCNNRRATSRSASEWADRSR